MRIWTILLACQPASTSVSCNRNPFFDCNRHFLMLPLCIRSRSHTYRSGRRSCNVLLRWRALSQLLIAISRLLPQPSSVDSYLKSRLSNNEQHKIGYIPKYPTCLNMQFRITDIIDIWSDKKISVHAHPDQWFHYSFVTAIRIRIKIMKKSVQ